MRGLKVNEKKNKQMKSHATITQLMSKLNKTYRVQKEVKLMTFNARFELDEYFIFFSLKRS